MTEEMESAGFKSAMLETDDTRVLDVIEYMADLRGNMVKGGRASMSRAMASVLRVYPNGHLASKVRMEDFKGFRGAGVRSFLEFRMRYEELMRMRGTKYE